ncbi:ABC transporter permease subunit [Pseudofrankia sp. BMG5.37]|uniref:ABC transporter permease subunit n=1 Tax=Pseudofrankia sp. BMG5.37 TaxID=3050035 RepID=UPI0028949A2D|nr:ABC transporter permease [Pseudofrankia sp. BMG5.37]MDT3440429.1 ABC transporter permease [Pseudofrankia sp. BMG5.37]
MHEFLVFTISGLTTAGIYAISASGLTLTYVTTGVFNIAHGATGMLAAFTYWQLAVGWGLPAPLALPLCVLVAAPLFGLLLERLVMRRLAGAPESTRLVVTVAVLVVLVSLVQWLWDPSTFRRSQELFAGKGFHLGTISVPYNDVLVLGVAAAVAVLLWLLLHHSRAGVAMRARVDDPSLATLNGARPSTSARLAWMTGTALAALAGILIAPKLTMSAIPLTLLIVNAYAAAVIGRLRSLPMTFVGALVVGLAADYAVGYLPKVHYGQQYLRGALPVVPVLVLLVALLVLRASRLRGRPALAVREITPTPTWGGGLGFCAAVVFGAVIAATTMSKADLFASTSMWGLAIVGVSMVPLVGYAGRISLCQLSFAGIGAAVVAHAGNGGNPAALLLAAAVAAVVGAVVSLPALRLSGIYLALLTGAFAVTLDNWIFQLPSFTVAGHRFDLFQGGTLSADRFRVGGFHTDSAKTFFITGAVLFALAALAVVAVRRSELGQRLIAVKESPAASATLGMNVRLTTLAVFTLSAGLAGLGGGVYASAVRSTTADSFSFFTGLTLLLLVVVAGVSSIGSGLAAGLLLGTAAISSAAGDSATRVTATLAGLAALALAANPNGLIPSVLRPAYEPVRRVPAVLVGSVGIVTGLWVLRLAHVVDGDVLMLGILVVAVAAPLLARSLVDRASGTVAVPADTVASEAAATAATATAAATTTTTTTATATAAAAAPVAAATGVGGGVVASGPDEGLSGPLEWLGFDAPVSQTDLDVLDARLALAGVDESRLGEVRVGAA